MRFAFFAPLLTLLAACSSTSGTEPESASEAIRTPDACARVLAAIRPAIDVALPQAHTRDVAVGVITNDCPFQGYTSGIDALAPDALYRIGSITKTYTAALIQDFVARGELRLDDTIARFGLNVPNEDTITIRQLLEHSSGLFNYNEDPDFPEHMDWTPRERLAVAARHPVDFEPGQSWHYSNTNYVALGIIAEQLGGETIGAQIREKVLAPRHLEHTFFFGAEPVDGALAPSFRYSGAPYRVNSDSFGAWADGAMVATLEDTTRWMRSYGARSELYTGVAISTGSPVTYSFALFNIPPLAMEDGAGHGHGGDLRGFHSFSIHVPERGWTVTVVVNQDSGDVNQDGRNVNAFLIAVASGLRACATAGGC